MILLSALLIGVLSAALAAIGWLLRRGKRLARQVVELKRELVRMRTKPDPQTAHLMGLSSPSDQTATMPARTWDAAKRALWRSKVALAIAERQAGEILPRVRHADGCPGAGSETEVCPPGCPDREIRLSALVILNAARQFKGPAARPADAPYFAPSREQYSETIAELAAAQAELKVLRGTVVTEPPDEEAEEEDEENEAETA